MDLEDSVVLGSNSSTVGSKVWDPERNFKDTLRINLEELSDSRKSSLFGIGHQCPVLLVVIDTASDHHINIFRRGSLVMSSFVKNETAIRRIDVVANVHATTCFLMRGNRPQLTDTSSSS